MAVSQRFARFCRSGVSSALIAALVLGSLQPWLHPDQDHDVDWPAIGFVDNGHQQMAAAPASDADPADHCAVCHFSRAARGQAASRTAFQQSRTGSIVTSHAGRVILLAGASGPLAARAPPALG